MIHRDRQHVKIALATPPVYQAPLPLEVHLPMIPQGPAMMAAVLRQRGHDVVCFDAYERSCRERHFDLSKFVEFLTTERPDWLGLSVYSDGYPAALAMAEAVRATLPDCIIIAGGPHFTLLPDSAPTSIDYVVVGEGEVALAAFVEGLMPSLSRAGTSQDVYFILRELANCSLYDGNCNIQFSVRSDRPTGSSSDQLQVIRAMLRRSANGHSSILTMQGRLTNDVLGRLPYPAYDLFMDEESTYQFDEPALGLDGPMLNINTSRGCSYGCSFCSVEGVWGKSYRWFPAPWVLGLVDSLKKKFGIRSVFFREDEFIMGPRAPSAWRDGEGTCDDVMVLARGLHALDVRWAIENRVDAFGSPDRAEHYFKTLAGLGLAGVFVGIESASEVVRNVILNKHLSVSAIRKFFGWAHEVDVCTVANVMYGVRRMKEGQLLTDSPRDWLATDALLAELRPTRIDRYVYVGVPVSPLYRDYLERGDFDLIDANGYLYPIGFEHIAREIYGEGIEMLTVMGRPNLRVGPGLIPGIPSAVEDRRTSRDDVESELVTLEELPGVLKLTLTPLRTTRIREASLFSIVDEFLMKASRQALDAGTIKDLLKRYQPGDPPELLRLISGPTLAISTLRTPSAEAVFLALQIAHNAPANDSILTVLRRVSLLINNYLRSKFLSRHRPAVDAPPIFFEPRRHLQVVRQ